MSFTRMVRRAFLPAMLITFVASSSVLEAQEGVGPDLRVSNALINGAIGATIVSVRQIFTGKLSWRDLAQGAAGGIVMSAGKQVSATGFDGSGLIGRQVSALGIALIASAGRDTFSITFPLGPAQLIYSPSAADRLKTRVDLFDVVVPLFGFADSDQHFDAAASLSSGSLVFVRPATAMPLGEHAAGFAMLGTISLGSHLSASERRRVLAHETIHVAQADAYRQLVTYPMERMVFSRIPGVRSAARYADPGLLAPGSVYLISRVLPYAQHPWEREAYGLAGR